MAGGILLVVGMGVARVGDNCASAGLRAARVSDDLAGGAIAAGRTVSWGADDAARLGRGVDGVGIPRVRGASLGEGAGALRGVEGSWPETLLEAGADIGIEVIQMDFGEVPVALTMPGEVRCPRLLEVSDAPDQWEALLGGLGVSCAPVVVVGVASDDGTALRMGEETTRLPELAQQCVDVGARCVFVGCPADVADACIESTRASVRGTRLQRTLSGYMRVLANKTIEQSSPPLVLAELSVERGGLVVVEPGAVRGTRTPR